MSKAINRDFLSQGNTDHEDGEGFITPPILTIKRGKVYVLQARKQKRWKNISSFYIELNIEKVNYTKNIKFQ